MLEFPYGEALLYERNCLMELKNMSTKQLAVIIFLVVCVWAWVQMRIQVLPVEPAVPTSIMAVDYDGTWQAIYIWPWTGEEVAEYAVSNKPFKVDGTPAVWDGSAYFFPLTSLNTAHIDVEGWVTIYGAVKETKIYTLQYYFPTSFTESWNNLRFRFY